LKELEQLVLEEWAKIPVARCAKRIETHPKNLAAVIAEKGGSTKYCLLGLNSYACSSSVFLSYFLFVSQKNIFCNFKVVGMLWKSNDKNHPKIHFNSRLQQNRSG
jgi:hypothetical protein